MRKKPRTYIVDMHSPSPNRPEPGQVFRHVSSKGVVLGYQRVVGVRQVRVRVSRGETARYALQVERLDGMPAGGATFTVHDHPRRPRTRPDPFCADRFLPLLPP